MCNQEEVRKLTRSGACLDETRERLGSPGCDFFWISAVLAELTFNTEFLSLLFIHFRLPIAVHKTIILHRFKYRVCFILVG